MNIMESSDQQQKVFQRYSICLLAVAIIILINYYVIASSFISETQTTQLSHNYHSETDSVAPVDLWFTAIDFTGRGSTNIILFLKIAILSASIYAPHLLPIVLVVGENPTAEKWLEERGNVLIFKEFHHTSILPFLEKNPAYITKLGLSTWLRLAIPEVVEVLKSTDDSTDFTDAAASPSKSVSGCDSAKYSSWCSKWQKVRQTHLKKTQRGKLHYDYVLNTDADIYFMNPFKLWNHELPRYVSLPIQGDALLAKTDTKIGSLFSRMHTNAGVMVLNVTSAIHEWRNEFDDFVMSQIIKFNGHATSSSGESSSGAEVNNFNDQTAFHQFFPIRLPELTLWDKFQMFFCCKTYSQTLFTKYYSNVLPKKFEWEPYLGPNEEEAVIVHWHGIKFKYQDDCGSIFNHQFTHPENVKLFAMANLTETEAQRLALLSEDEFNALTPSRISSHVGHGGYTHVRGNRQLLSFYEKLDQHPALTPSGFRIQTIRFFRYLNILCNRVDLKNRSSIAVEASRQYLNINQTSKKISSVGHGVTPSTSSPAKIQTKSKLRKVV